MFCCAAVPLVVDESEEDDIVAESDIAEALGAKPVTMEGYVEEELDFVEVGGEGEERGLRRRRGGEGEGEGEGGESEEMGKKEQ